MKVEVRDAGFKPVVITIETQSELDAVYDALGVFLNKAGTDGVVARDGFEVVRDLYVELP
jgi:hypothetical protein